MKNHVLLLLAFLTISAFTVVSTFPSANVKTLEGQTVDIKSYIGKGTPTVISFWATWCSPCKRELDAMAELYPEWQSKYKVEVIAITVDDARSLAKVPALVQSKGWKYTILSDQKQELQQALNFQDVPRTFLLDGQGNIVDTHIGYNPGDEFELEEKIKNLTGK